MTRDEAIKKVGPAAVAAVEKENCEPTSRLLPDHADYQEWKAEILCASLETGEQVVLSAMYYPKNKEFFAKHHFPNAAEGECLDDLSYINWQIDHYRIDGIA